MGFARVGIYWNPSKRAGLELARELKQLLQGYGIPVTTGITLAHALGEPELAQSSFDECDLLAVLGGDGTLLSALDYALPNDIPMLGINLGRLGLLSEVVPENMCRDVRQVLEGRYTTDSRMTLTFRGEDPANLFALNEVVVTRTAPAVRVLSLEIEVNGSLVDRISGDGLIVASATGSTAYSLSAGGPIVRPGLDCFVITPICPHTMTARPVVVSSDDEVTIRVLDEGCGAHAVFDGRKTVEIDPGAAVHVVRSSLKASFIRLHDRNYFSLLREKLSDWTH